MKLKFKIQPYQTAAVQAVVNCFKGQVVQHGGVRYRLDPGVKNAGSASFQSVLDLKTKEVANQEAAFRNADVTLSESALLDNIQQVQRLQNLPVSAEIVKTKVSKLNPIS